MVRCKEAYLDCILYRSLKYAATVVFVRPPDVSSLTSNCSLSADWLDTPHTVYFLFIEGTWVVCTFAPIRKYRWCNDLWIRVQRVVKENIHDSVFFLSQLWGYPRMVPRIYSCFPLKPHCDYRWTSPYKAFFESKVVLPVGGFKIS